MTSRTAQSPAPEAPSPAPAGTSLAVAAVVAAAALWSLSGVFVKILYGEGGTGAHPLAITVYRSAAGGLMLLPWAVAHAQTLRVTHPVWPALSIASFALMSATFVAATAQTAAANAIILQYTSPIWVFLLGAPLLGERVRRHDWGVLTLAILGLAIIYFGQSSDRAGLNLALISGFGYGCVTLFIRKLRAVHPLVVTTLNALGSAIVLSPLLIAQDAWRVSGAQLGGIIGMGFVQFILPYVLFAWALRRLSAARVALLTLLECVLNPVWTWLFLHEQPPAAALIGAPIVLAAIAIKSILDSRRETGRL